MEMKKYVITIARGFGSGGKDIGMRLSEALNIPCYERQILTMASDKSGIDESVFVENDEKLRGKYIANFLRRVPVIGIVENLSYFECPNCSERIDFYNLEELRIYQRKLH